MRADQPHGLARRRAQGRQPKAADDGVEDRLRRLAGMDDAGGDAERPRRRRDEERGRFEVAIEPAAGGELVFDQAVGGCCVRHAQQRLGQHHQRKPLFGRQRVGVQKIFNAAKPAGFGADRLNKRAGADVDAALSISVSFGVREKAGRQFLVGRREQRPKQRHFGSGGRHRGLQMLLDALILRASCTHIATLTKRRSSEAIPGARCFASSRPPFP